MAVRIETNRGAISVHASFIARAREAKPPRLRPINSFMYLGFFARVVADGE